MLVDVAVSSALVGLLHGPPRPLEVLAAAPAAVHLGLAAPPRPGAPRRARARDVGDLQDVPDVIAVVAPGAVALPNAVVLPDPVVLPSANVRDGSRVDGRTTVGATTVTLGATGGRIGGGRLELHVAAPDAPVAPDGARVTRLALRAVRWWDARVGRLAVERRVLAAQGRALEVHVADAGLDPDPFVPDLAVRLDRVVASLVRGVESEGYAAAIDLLGRGRGFTPAGDDALAGLLLAGATLRPSGAEPAVTALERLAVRLVPMAPGRTSRPSAALLALAAEGRVAPPVVRLVRAIAAGADALELSSRVSAVLSLGHGSGRDLLLGLRAGIALIVAVARRGRDASDAPAWVASVGGTSPGVSASGPVHRPVA